MRNYLRQYLRMLEFARSFKAVLALAVVVMGVATLFDGLSLTMILPFLDRVLNDSKIVVPVKLPDFAVTLVTMLNAMPRGQVLRWMVVALVLLFAIKEVFVYFQSYLMNVLGYGVVREARNKLYGKLQTLSMDFYADKRAGELISRVTNDVGFITNALSYGLGDLIYQSMQAALYGTVAVFLGFSISWKFALVMFFIFPAIMYPMSRIGSRIKKFTVETQNKMADLNSLLAETIQGAYIVKVFNREDYEQSRFEKINQNYYKFMMKSVKRTLIMPSLTEFVGAIGVVLILIIAGNDLISGKVSAGAFMMFLGFLMSTIRPVKKLAGVHAINQQAFASANRIYDILEQEPKIKEKPQALDIAGVEDSIEFEDVWFAYEEGKDVLKGVNLKVRRGEVVAIVGHSGAGKSTMVGLLPRLYDPYKGRILIDGTDISHLKLKALRNVISVVSQEMVLFNATIKDNIAYGRPGATDEEIREAAKKAYALDFIERLPDGFGALIGDRGTRLSGGERQRLAIARAILKNAPILILDEATSQLDTRTEQMIKQAFYNLIQGKTAFVIAHRLSTVQQADRILVMTMGQIAEQGTHAELVGRDSLYRDLYRSQFH